MVKKDLKLTIEEPLLKKAKREIPNLSQFVEKMFKAYFDCENIERTMLKHRIMIEEEKVSNLNMNIALMQEQLLNTQIVEENTTEKQNNEWDRLFRNYKSTGHINKLMLEDTSEILNISQENLTEILDFYMENIGYFSAFKIQSNWEYALEQYNENKG